MKQRAGVNDIMSQHEIVSAYCADIGTNRLLVQAAGGNISWKTSETLWVKASGTWLADAKQKNIFLPVDLRSIKEKISEGNYEFGLQNSRGGPLRPSIETLFHALITSTIVLHTHSVEALATLVRKDADLEIEKKIGQSLDWILLDYHKPGPKLAKAIHDALKNKPSANVIFMRNHGIIIGGESIQEVDGMLKYILSALRQEVHYKALAVKDPPEIPGYRVASDTDVHSLVQHEILRKRLNTDWVLYPDHVIFLDQVAENDLSNIGCTGAPTHLFIPDIAVYERLNITRAARSQLLCYLDVVCRQLESAELIKLSKTEINELLNWDAEKFRQSINK